MDYHIKKEIVYYLDILRFIRKNDIDNSRIGYLIEYLSDNERIKIDIPDFVIDNELPEEIIEKCDSETIKLCLIRDAKDVDKSNNSIIVKGKKQYKLDYVFKNENYDDMLFRMIEFLEKRIRLQINSSIVMYGYSSAGKSFLTGRLIQKLNPERISLCEIHNNEKYIYKKGLKIKSNEDWIFKADYNLANIIDKFTTRKDNMINKSSTRGHVIVTLWFGYAYVQIFDLCGNEKLPSKLKDRYIIEESKFINKSLYNMIQFISKKKIVDKQCVLTKTISRCSHIIFNLIMNDNSTSQAVNMIDTLKDIFL